jgi:hypothetical protein
MGGRSEPEDIENEKNFKVIQYAYNDQPPESKYDGMFYGPKKKPGQKDTQNLKLAHSKVL